MPSYRSLRTPAEGTEGLSEGKCVANGESRESGADVARAHMVLDFGELKACGDEWGQTVMPILRTASRLARLTRRNPMCLNEV